MAYAFLLAIICLGLFGAFLTIRGLVHLYKDNQRRMFRWTLAFFLFSPLLLTLALYAFDGRWTVWVSLPVILFGFAWICEGYFLESFLRKEKQRRLDGLKRVIPKAPPNMLTKQLTLIGIGLAVWCVGAFVGIPNATAESCLLCLSVYLFARGLATLWKYRGF